MIQKGLRITLPKYFKSIKFWIGILFVGGILVWISWNFVYSPYLGGLSSSETRLYLTLKETEHIQSLQNLNAETTVKLYLHSIKKEDWNISPLFYVNGDGTLNNAFGTEMPTPSKLKGYVEKFRGVKGSLVQAGGKNASVGYIDISGNQVLSLKRKEDVWYINGMLVQ